MPSKWNLLLAGTAAIKKQNHSPQSGQGEFLKCSAGQENNFTQMLLRESRRKLDIQFLKARQEHTVVLPLAVRGRNESRARFRAAAPRLAPTSREGCGGSFRQPLLPPKAFASTVKCQGPKERVWNVRWGKLKTSTGSEQGTPEGLGWEGP